MPNLLGLQFGSGDIFATPVAGALVANPTPIHVVAIQNVKCTFGAEIKELYGQLQWSLDSAVGKRSIKGTFEFAQMSNAIFSQLFFADPITTGSVSVADAEAHTIPATPYEVTVTNAGDTPLVDLGVVYAATGIPLEMHGTPTTGQYSVDVSTGVYTFAAADTLLDVFISYSWTNTAGNTMTAGNHAMGYGPIISMNVIFPYEGVSGGGIGFEFPLARLGKIDLATKLDDYMMMTTDFSAFSGASNNPFNSYQAF